MLAFAQPLFDLLARYPTFLVAHRAGATEILVLVVVLVLVVPALLITCDLLARMFSARGGWYVHLALVGLLAGVIVLPPLSGAVSLWWLAMALSVACGVGVAILYANWHPARMFLSILAIAWLVVPGVFLARESTRKLLAAPVDAQAMYAPVNSDAPVVMVIFDGLPVVSLMNAEREIDARLFPNFAALAADATWYRNATAVHQLTGHAVPAILTGNYPDHRKLPTIRDHPYNLFTLLGGSYELNVYEDVTLLCPQTDSADRAALADANLPARLQALGVDLSIVYLHVLLPDALTTRLPAITDTWKNFFGLSHEEIRTKAGESHLGRPARFAQFVDSIEPTERPPVHFMHILLPHYPCVHLPSGKLYVVPNYEHTPGLDAQTMTWGNIPWLVLFAYQRHLLQTQLADRLLGDLIERLQELDLYDSALMVVTADHGESFWPDEARRDPARTDHPYDVLAVPLLIKAPGQREAIIDDRNVETIDVLPTMADVLAVDLPWDVDGRSALDEWDEPRPDKSIENQSGQRLRYDNDPEAKYETLAHKLESFPHWGEPDGLFRYGPFGDLVGTSVDAGGPRASGYRIELDSTMLSFGDLLTKYAERNRGQLVPAFLIGNLTVERQVAEPPRLAVATQGTIRAVVPTFAQGAGVYGFNALVPEHSFRPGDNPIEFYLVEGTEDRPRLRRIPSEPTFLQVDSEVEESAAP